MTLSCPFYSSVLGVCTEVNELVDCGGLLYRELNADYFHCYVRSIVIGSKSEIKQLYETLDEKIIKGDERE